MLENNKEIYKE